MLLEHQITCEVNIRKIKPEEPQEDYQSPAKYLYESHRVGHRSKIIVFSKVLTFRCIITLELY